MIKCEIHGEIQEIAIGSYNFCPECMAERTLLPRIKSYELIVNEQ